MLWAERVPRLTPLSGELTSFLAAGLHSACVVLRSPCTPDAAFPNELHFRPFLEDFITWVSPKALWERLRYSRALS